MISICIPLYNFDSRKLVEVLRQQLDQLTVDGEIIVIDDFSAGEYQIYHQEIAANCDQFIPLEHNIGRAKIRNLFLKHSRKDYLLFLDCDGIVVQDDFLEKYLRCIEEIEPTIIVGGRVYGSSPNNREQMLAWQFGVTRESKPAAWRSKNPNVSFQTSNFIIKKGLLERVNFDESISTYGHEDTLLGYELSKKNIAIHHIENPILNGDIENTEKFLHKTKTSIENLYRISKRMNHDQAFTKDIKLLRFWKSLRSFSGLYQWIYGLLSNNVERNLYSDKPNIRALDMYKLNHLMEVAKSGVS